MVAIPLVHRVNLMKLAFVLNGKPTEVEFEPQETLAEVLRDRCNLTGLKLSCEVQVCGACTALVDGVPVSACTYLAYEARGRQVTTIEGIGNGERLHPIQKAFLDEFAFQCGFCTPGMILAAKALLDENPEPTAAEVVKYMDGNLCRCTGYLPILKAIRLAASLMRHQEGQRP
jgi:carbon-monoxide dehydrogenase small subunit